MERIIGKNLTPEKAAVWEERAEERKRKGKESFEGEFEKTAEDLKMIEKINSYLAEEFEESGAKEKMEPISPEQIHYLSQESYAKNFSEAVEMGATALYFEVQRAIHINAETFSKRMEKYYATLHEATHAAAVHQTRVEEKEGKPKIAALKCGYGTTYLPEKGKFIYQFIGFNEAVTEKITRETVTKHQEEIAKEFGLSKKEIMSVPDFYGDFLKILNAAVKKTAKKSGEAEEAVWKKIKKGYFEGEMMHLRDIERACGAGALRMLAAIGESPDFASRAETSEMILIYFQTDDEAEKEEIANIILKEKELEKYQKRQSPLKTL